MDQKTLTKINSKHMKLDIDKNWLLVINSEAPIGSQIARADGKFFKVSFNSSMGYVQPVIEENTNSDGICGTVVPIVKRTKSALMVAVADNKRPGSTVPLYLTEATRFSVDNAANLIEQQCSLIDLGSGYSNSARIIGRIKCGVLVVGEDFPLPRNSRWISFLS